MQRYGMVIGIRPEMIGEHKRLHAAVWPTVLAQISRSHIRNYTIYLREPENLLFSYFEYHGENYDFGPMKMSPVPPKAVPIIIGGHSKPALSRPSSSPGRWASSWASWTARSGSRRVMAPAGFFRMR